TATIRSALERRNSEATARSACLTSVSRFRFAVCAMRAAGTATPWDAGFLGGAVLRSPAACAQRVASRRDRQGCGHLAAAAHLTSSSSAGGNMSARLYKFVPLAAMLLVTVLTAAQTATRVVPAGQEIKVSTDQAIQATTANAGQVYPATVSQDTTDQSGKVVIPRGSRANLAVVRTPDGKNVTLDLRDVTINGRRYSVSSPSTAAPGTEGLGVNKRTGKYVGGGALAGTVIGAIAGGGKGAA